MSPHGHHENPVPLDTRFPLWESGYLRIVSEKRIREFIEREPRSSDVMWRWIDVIESSNWRSPADLKASFRVASFVGDLTVFNVGGNNYRIVAFVQYRKQIVYAKRIDTHKEYDTWDL